MSRLSVKYQNIGIRNTLVSRLFLRHRCPTSCVGHELCVLRIVGAMATLAAAMPIKRSAVEILLSKQITAMRTLARGA
jgi:hypothetical protein